jgi:hypothetical protein
MSRDVVASARSVFAGRDLLAELDAARRSVLGVAVVPPLDLVVGRGRVAGAVVREGARLGADAVLGPGTGQPVIDVLDETGASLAVAVTLELPGEWRLVATPRADAFAFAAALALGLAVARAGRGTVDLDRFDVSTPTESPAEVEQLLRPTGLDSCASYQQAVAALADRVPGLRDWPRA